jgi:hypothetical protein
LNSLLQMPRSVVSVMLALSNLESGATYKGLGHLLNLKSDSGVRAIVRTALKFGVIRVEQPYAGRGAKAVIVITREGKQLLEDI